MSWYESLLPSLVKLLLEKGLPFLDETYESQKATIDKFISDLVPGTAFDGLVIQLSGALEKLLLSVLKKYLEGLAGPVVALEMEGHVAAVVEQFKSELAAV